MAESLPDSILEFLMVNLKVLFFLAEAVIKFFLPRHWLRKDVKGQKVLITGAGSGLGKLMAHRFKDLGCDLVLWDINGEAVEQIAKEFQGKINCKAYTVDLANRDQIAQMADKVRREFGSIDILVNNAGIVTGRKFLECPDGLMEKTMQVNTNAHFWTTKAFLPEMIARNCGHIVSIASSAGLFGVNGLADYCASKFGAVGFDESLRNELHAMGKTGVHTTVVCPYFINTGMFNGVKTRFPGVLPILDPEDTVTKIMDAILCNQTMIILPRFLYVAYALKGILPVKAAQVMNNYMGVSESMDTFVGRAQAEKKTS